MTWINFSQVKQQADFLAVLNHFAITGKQKGDEVRILCPFHDDQNPSLGINVADNKFNCFGCNEHGNVLDFATLLDGGDPQNTEDLRKGAKLVMDVCGIETPRMASKRRKPKNEAPVKKAVNKAQNAKFSASGDVINPPLKFQLNLSQDTDFFERNSISQSQVELFEMGLATKGTMVNRIAIPIHNEKNELVAYVGRWALDELPEDEDKYKFPNGFKKTQVLYNLNRLIEAKHKHIVLVEGFWSVQRLHQKGIASVACMGTTISETQMALLKQAGIKFITIIFDGDEAGRNGATKVLTSLSRCFYTRVIDLEDGVKPDTMGENYLSRLGG